MRAALLLSLLWAASQCGSMGDDLVVNVQGRWPELTALEVTATLNGMAAKNERVIQSDLDTFSVHLPAGSAGMLVVEVAGLESDQCKGGTGQVSVPIHAGMAAGSATLVLARLPTKLCTLQVVADRGMGQLLSSPAGLTCSGTQCTGDFPSMSQVQIFASPDSRSYAYWSGSCQGTGACTVTMDKKQQVTASYLPRSCSKDGWCWDNPLPTGNTPRGVWARGSDDIWSVGAGGSILHFDGKIWAPVSSGTTASLNGIWGSGGGDIWIVGAGGTLLHSMDGGTNWSAGTSGTNADLEAIWGSGANDVWIVGAAGALLHFNGQKWSPDSKSGSFPALNSIWGSANNNIWTVGDLGTLVHYDGMQWAEASESRMLAQSLPPPTSSILRQSGMCGAAVQMMYGRLAIAKATTR